MDGIRRKSLHFKMTYQPTSYFLPTEYWRHPLLSTPSAPLCASSNYSFSTSVLAIGYKGWTKKNLTDHNFEQYLSYMSTYNKVFWMFLKISLILFRARNYYEILLKTEPKQTFIFDINVSIRATLKGGFASPPPTTM